MEKSYQRIIEWEDGSTTVWHYDASKFANGPFRVEVKYTKKFWDDLAVKKERKKRTAVVKA